MSQAPITKSHLYRRKLYALLHTPPIASNQPIARQLEQIRTVLGLADLDEWWHRGTYPGIWAASVGSASDRVNLPTKAVGENGEVVQIRHPISGNPYELPQLTQLDGSLWESLLKTVETFMQHPFSTDDERYQQLFWWLWRFYPEVVARSLPEETPGRKQQGLLFPAHAVLPDCPMASYGSTVSALAGALFPADWQPDDHPTTPYLLVFSFSPVQEFIKASRKFLDFWAGSYLLHYLSVKLCWHIADQYGPDSIIVPSLWSQDVVDALMIKAFDATNTPFTPFTTGFETFTASQTTPVDRFNQGISSSLSTAGFPNVITALVPGKAAAQALGASLSQQLVEEWHQIGTNVRQDIQSEGQHFLQTAEKYKRFWEEFRQTLTTEADCEACERDLQQLQQPGCWEWRKLWDAQLANSWEPYWTAVPLGDPGYDPVLMANTPSKDSWIQAQHTVAQPSEPLPTDFESRVFNQELNVGTWWGACQQRLREVLSHVKATRTWQIPAAPGERSSLSGRFSAVHPRLHYDHKDGYTDFREGGGVPRTSMRLFWALIAKVYPGLFDGSETLNALELTKRMAWQFGGVAADLGIRVEALFDQEDLSNTELNIANSEPEHQEASDAARVIDYEKLIRFPNLSSIAAARFIHDAWQQSTRVQDYWKILAREVNANLSPQQRRVLGSRTRGRPLQIQKTDRVVNPTNSPGKHYNGTMFSSKWLADDMGLVDPVETTNLRKAINTAHRQVQFGEGSPADWWVMVLADGDSMGSYISGQRLQPYGKYVVNELVDQTVAGFNQADFDGLLSVRKRMGPATHIGLNRALLDFSNRLVPYLAEQRCCGRVVYSGGDDVMVVLPLEDTFMFARSLRAAWSADSDPYGQFTDRGDYWYPNEALPEMPQRSYFTMGKGATMSMGVVVAYKTVPLPTVLASLWEAESQAKAIAGKDGICLRVIYGGGNQLQALMKGSLLENWWQIVADCQPTLSPLLYRLAEELPRRCMVTPDLHLFSKAAQVLASSREDSHQLSERQRDALCNWLYRWEVWAEAGAGTLGTSPDDLGNLLRFSAFWVDKIVQRQEWLEPENRTQAGGQ